jgi:hypothetical protein
MNYRGVLKCALPFNFFVFFFNNSFYTHENVYHIGWVLRPDLIYIIL